MKKLAMLSMVFLFSVLAFAGGKEIKVSVNGMVCGFCAQGITKKFKSESSIEKVDVSLEKKLVIIDLKKGADIPNDKIEKILKDSGYNVAKIER